MGYAFERFLGFSFGHVILHGLAHQAEAGHRPRDRAPHGGAGFA